MEYLGVYKTYHPNSVILIEEVEARMKAPSLADMKNDANVAAAANMASAAATKPTLPATMSRI